MRTWLIFAMALSGLSLPVNGSDSSKEIVLRYDFQDGSRGWLPGFSDYSLMTSDLQRVAEIRELPEEVARGFKAYYLQSMNRSDDVFMYLKKELGHEEGLEAGRLYSVTIDIEVASNAPTGCFGIGGAPGEGVWLKAGVSPMEPVSILSGDFVTLNLDKGNQSGGGQDAGVVSDIANGDPCESPHRYVLLHRVYHHPKPVRSRLDGHLWVFVGTDSGFEGLTGLYYYSIQVTLRPIRE
jgi:hypothetical protein